jgi:lipoprotein-releasing system ATP-binding protein
VSENGARAAVETLLKLSAVNRSFDGALAVLKDIDFSLSKGQSVAITGPSGSGKSTLLNIMGGLDLPSSGTVDIAGKTLGQFSEEALAHYRNQTIGFVFQLHHLLPQCTALENVLIPTLAPDQTSTALEARQRAESLLERVGLKDRMTHRPGQLSGGERQRVAVVRALINKPGLLLADEPTGALDQQNTEELTQLLIELNNENAGAMVVVTHSLAVAKQMNEHFELCTGVLKKLGANR